MSAAATLENGAVNEISGSRGCDYEKFYGLGI
jgi:hypothetical protein